jgi:toxin ParE1/3/4
MLPVVLRPAARNDQLDLAEYYDGEAGEAVGNRFLQQCDAGFERLARFPESGTPVRYKHPKLEGCRFTLVPEFERILIFYKPLPERIEIVRILHGARDIEEALN